MKIFLRYGMVLVTALLCVYIQNVQSDSLWSDDVDSVYSPEAPLGTLWVEAGALLSVSAAEDDQWRILNIGTLYDWTNANGLSFDYEGIPYGALAGRIGEDGDWFFIGSDFCQTASQSGTLYLACWEPSGNFSDNSDAITVTASLASFDPADLDQDYDVDGKDLFRYLQDLSALDLESFAAIFGWVDTPATADLQTLSVSPGRLASVFSADQSDYLVEVENETSEIQVTALPADPLATVWISDTLVDPGTPFAVSLDLGANYIPVRVVSQNNRTEKTYSLLVARKGTAGLSGLSAEGYDLIPAFSPDTAVYTIYAASDTTEVQLNLEPGDGSDQIQVNGTLLDDPALPVYIPLESEMTEAQILVAASDGSEFAYFVYIKRNAAPSQTAFVKDDAVEANEFESLPEAVAYLNTNLLSGQTGEIRIQTSSAMVVDTLDLTRNIILTVEPGASNVIFGPSTYPLIINTWAGADISGLCFTGSPAFTINSGAGLCVAGSSFSSDTTVNIEDSVSSTEAKGGGYYSQFLNFVGNHLSGDLNIMMSGSADTDFVTSGNQAESIQFAGTGEFSGDANLKFKANLTDDLSIMATMKGNTHASVTGHRNVVNTDIGITMEDDARISLEQHTSASVGLNFMGLNGKIQLDNVTTVNAAYKMDMAKAQYTGRSNAITNFNASLLYSHGDSIYGITQEGGKFLQNYSIKAAGAGLNATLTLGLDGVNIYGKYNLIAGGNVTAKFNNNTTISLDAYMKLPGKLASLDFDHMTCYGKLSVELPESGVEVYLNAQYGILEEGLLINFTDLGGVSGTLDHIVTVTGGLILRFGAEEPPTPENKAAALTKGNTLVLKNLEIKDTNGLPGLYLEKINTAVTIQDSTIESQNWAIYCAGINAAVTIKDNANLTGGIFLNGDPDGTGVLIDQPHEVSANTITQTMAGGACLWSHSIRNVQVSGNTMTAAAGAHGIMVSGGKLVVDGGSIIAPGAYTSAALGAGPSSGGTVGFLDVSNMELISGAVNPGDDGYIKLTGNTFSNATVHDVEAGRLINDPMDNGNSGLNPDEDIVGCLIDWNEDDHHCPDYPPDCDQWDEDEKECGCGQDGIAPPSEPGI